MRKQTFAVAVVVVVAFMSSFVSSAKAVVLFNNWGPNNTYNGNTGWTVNIGAALQAHLEQASVFTVTGGDYFLNTVDLAVGHLFGPNVLFVRLHADDNNKPGAVIAQTVVVDQMQPLPSDPKVNHPPVVATFPGATLLEGGTNYWISLDVDTSVTDAWLAWNYNITNDRALRADRTDGGPWVTYPQFPEPRGTMRINATPVPEPTGVVLFAAVGMALARRRSR
jgi:hypothetical protein